MNLNYTVNNINIHLQKKKQSFLDSQNQYDYSKRTYLYSLIYRNAALLTLFLIFIGLTDRSINHLTLFLGLLNYAISSQVFLSCFYAFNVEKPRF